MKRWKHLISRPFLVGAALLLAALAPGGTAGAQTLALRAAAWETDGPVFALARTSDTLYLGGEFSCIGPHMGRSLPLDPVTGPPALPFLEVDGVVRTCVADGFGGWFLGGAFTRVGSLVRNNIAHVLASGEVDPGWDADADDQVDQLAVSGSRVYVRGIFMNIGGQARGELAALDRATGKATGWVAPTTGGVLAMAVSGPKVYIGGWEMTVGGEERNGLAALDAETGALTPWDPQPSGGNPYYLLSVIDAMAISGSTIYVGGHFTTIGGQTRTCFAALDQDTGVATAWNPQANGAVEAMAVSGSTLYLGGTFTAIGGQPRHHLAALDLSTHQITAWNPDVNGSVQTLAVSNGMVYAGGSFTGAGGQFHKNIVALNAATGAPAAWQPTAYSSVSNLAIYGSTIYAGGASLSVGGQVRRGLAALNIATGKVTLWNPDTTGTVYALAAAGSTVYAGGTFSSIGGQARGNIAALSVATGKPTAWNPNTTGTIQTLAVSGSTVYAGGSFSKIGGQARAGLAALDAATGQATPWNPDTRDEYLSMTIQPRIDFIKVSGSTVYVSGDFNRIGGQERDKFAALDAVTGLATPWNPGTKGNSSGPLAVAGTTVYKAETVVDVNYKPAESAETAGGGYPYCDLYALNVNSGAVYWHWGFTKNRNGFIGELRVAGPILYAVGRFGESGGGNIGVRVLNAASGSVIAETPIDWAGGVYALELAGSSLYAAGRFSSIGGVDRSCFAVFDVRSGVADWAAYR